MNQENTEGSLNGSEIYLQLNLASFIWILKPCASFYFEKDNNRYILFSIVLNFSLGARSRGHKQRKNGHVTFPLFVSSEPLYQAEFQYIGKTLLTISLSLILYCQKRNMKLWTKHREMIESTIRCDILMERSNQSHLSLVFSRICTSYTMLSILILWISHELLEFSWSTHESLYHAIEIQWPSKSEQHTRRARLMAVK